jgi:hypothetical protein
MLRLSRMTTTQANSQSIDADELRQILGDMPKADLLGMVVAASEIEKKLSEDGPETDDELWWWIKSNLGIEVPRKPVCDDHDAPFDFIAAAYFNRYPAILAMANRGGGKTFLVALLHWLNSEFKPGHEGATFGATEAQSLRCYAHLKNWVNDDEGNRRPQISSSVMRETVWNSGSKVEVLAGTPEAVNGPHPQVAHADEVELMRQDTWDESRNMAVSKQVNGETYLSQEILTSTRKSLHGRMQTLIDGIQKAVKLGARPDYKLIIWCIFEIAQEVPSCQVVPDEDREARLEELGRDPCEKCDCHLYVKGEWPDTGKPRYLKDVCKGRLFRSRGYLPYSDIAQKFQQNSIFTWEAQQECTKPETEFNYLKGFAEERHGIRGYSPDPDNGDIFTSTDWGGTNPHAVNWYQLLGVDLLVRDFYDNEIRLIEGTLVVFDEIYQAEIGVKKLGQLVKTKERNYQRQFPGWKVKSRFADPQGKMARLDWKDMGLKTIWKTTRDFEEQVEWLVRDWWEPGLLRYSIEKTPMFAAEAQSWQRDPKTGNQIDEFNHCMSNLRYCTANIHSIGRRAKNHDTTRPRAQGRHQTATVVRDTRRRMEGPLAVRDRRQTEDWRKRLGGPAV